MQTSTKKKAPQKPPQENRRASFRTTGRKKSNGSSQAGTNSFAGHGTGLHLLTFKSKPLFEVEMLAGGAETSKGKSVLGMIDTEAKQLQAIEDLWAIVRAQPKYKTINSPSWDPETSPITIIQYLLRKLGPLAGGNRWTIDTYQEGKKTRYRFVVYRFYPSNRVRNRNVYLPLDFLPGLEKRDKNLHDLFVDVIALVSRDVKIPLWDEDGDYSEGLDELLTARNMTDKLRGDMFGDTTLARHGRQRTIYSTGIAAQYLSLIRQRMKAITPENIKNRAWNGKSGRLRELLYQIKKGADLAKKKDQIRNYTFIPNYKGFGYEAISPYRSYKFIWSQHNGDILEHYAYNKLQHDENNAGGYLPVAFAIAKPGQKLPSLNQSDFPCLLDDWIGWTEYLITRRYCDYFYKKGHEEILSPSERLLEQIELNQTKNDFHERHKSK